MDDFASKITDLLNDPEGLNQISQLASSLMSGKDEKKPSDEQGLDLPFDVSKMGSIMKVMSAVKQQSQDDNNTRLLIALKPHLSKERGEKVDKAISLLKIVKLLPILKESGLMNLIS